VTTGAAPPAAGTPAAMRVDRYAFDDPGQPTANAGLALNLPADATAGRVHSYQLTLFDSLSRPRVLDVSFTKEAQANTWAVGFAGRPGDTMTVAPADAGGTPGGGQALNFDPNGRLVAPSAYAIGVTYADGASATFALDMDALTQYAGDFQVDAFTQDGYGQGMLEDIAVNTAGEVVGTFDNGQVRPLYRLALANFVNPDGLQADNGTVFTVGATSGPPMYGTAGTQGIGTIEAGALERSNVDLGDQFSRMILTQNAYNSSATAFRTINEMTEVARDLKS
jgi:flagellar hook protein FlgE